MYDENLIAPMRAELSSKGIVEVRSALEIDGLLSSEKGTVLFFINSVCGCAARSARPGLLNALQTSTIKPKVVVTAFAGNDMDAVTRIRALCSPIPPSSPSAALFRNGKPVHCIQRHQIEGRNPAEVSALFVAGFEKYCGPEVREDLEEKVQAGTSVTG